MKKLRPALPMAPMAALLPLLFAKNDDDAEKGDGEAGLLSAAAAKGDAEPANAANGFEDGVCYSIGRTRD